MDLRQLRYFIVLAETLSFRRAAERLNISQPPLTVAIRKLEEDLGAPLFSRSTRGVALTPAGEAALESARATLLQADKVRQAVNERTDAERGRLVIGFVSSATYDLLPRLLAAFRRRYPRVELALEESGGAEIARRLRLRQMDVGLVRLPLLEPVHLETSLLETDELLVAVPDAHVLGQRRSAPLGLLASEPFIGFPAGSVLRDVILRGCHRAGFAPNVAQEVAHPHTLMSLVQSGLGVGLVPAKAARHAPEGVKLLRPTEPLRIEMGLALPRDAGNRLAIGLRTLAEAELAPDRA
jgi:DNA-binding transcriptional LysR family regulator